MAEAELQQALDRALAEIDQLKHRLVAVEAAALKVSQLPKTMLFSHSYLARAFTVFAYHLVVSLIIGIPFYMLILAIVLAVGLGPFGLPH